MGVDLMNCLQAARPRGMRVLTATVALGAIVWMANILGVQESAFAQTTQRSVQGRVVNSSDAPINGAIVYLSDTRTMTVETYITQADGAYSFEQLSPNDDYKLWAQAKGKKSESKILSSFDDRPIFRVIIRIDTSR